MTKKQIAITCALLLGIVLATKPAHADELTQQANQAFVFQVADCISTRPGSDTPNVREGDPLARPFVHSLPSDLLAAAFVNVGLRYLFHRHPKAFHYVDAIESAMVVNNIEVYRNVNR